MKSVILVLVIFASQISFAGRLKEVVIMAQESMTETLGIDESYLDFSSMDFVTPTSGDLAVKAQVTVVYTTPVETYVCVTEFKRNAEFYSVLKTICN